MNSRHVQVLIVPALVRPSFVAKSSLSKGCAVVAMEEPGRLSAPSEAVLNPSPVENR